MVLELGLYIALDVSIGETLQRIENIFLIFDSEPEITSFCNILFISNGRIPIINFKRTADPAED